MWGIGVTSLMILTENPATCNALIAASLPTPGPFSLTSAVFIPWSMACLRASCAANCAAKGVLFLDPLKPCLPALELAITFPSVSVIVIIVLLKVEWIWIMPVGTILFSFLALLPFFTYLSMAFPYMIIFSACP